MAHLADRARVSGDDRVLDVGCGYGASARWLAARLGCQVVGLTISRRQARLAQRRHRRGGQARRTAVVRADADDLPFADAAFDVVWVIECLEHLTDKGRFFREAARMLRPGGRLALCSWQRAGRDGADQVSAVCEAFLCPTLASPDEYRAWCDFAGLELTWLEDLTPEVRATWDILQRRVGRLWLAPLRRLLAPELRRFLSGFPIIARAYDSGAMSYGLLVARRR